MASVQVREVPPIPHFPEVEVTLTLSRKEALALFLLTGCVGGTPRKTIREFTEPINWALSALFDEGKLTKGITTRSSLDMSNRYFSSSDVYASSNDFDE